MVRSVASLLFRSTRIPPGPVLVGAPLRSGNTALVVGVEVPQLKVWTGRRADRQKDWQVLTPFESRCASVGSI